MFLPITAEDMRERNWTELDFLYISGDAYVDHPSFGHAIITRLLESMGFKVGIIPQPDWRDIEQFKILGRPKYAVLVSSGVIDSMVNHYTVSKKRRNDDVYSPGGKAGYRPDRAVTVYCNKIREAFGNIPVLIGGIEASLRRFAHYDYWSDSVKHSILSDSQADLLMYGMGEKPITEIANAFKEGKSVKEMRDIRGTAYISKKEDLDEEIKAYIDGIESGAINPKEWNDKYVYIHSYEDVKEDKVKYAEAFKVQHDEQDPFRGRIIIQKEGNRYVIQNQPQFPLTQKEMDRVYALNYERTYHPSYEKMGGIPAIKEVEFSITSHRGCFGGCNFCALHFHQGRIIQNRSEKSILTEAEKLTWLPNFKGYIHDVGGPSANFRDVACDNQMERGACKARQCLFPTPCKNIKISHKNYLNLLRKVRAIKGVKKVFVRSGIRYDYLIYDKDDEFFYELCKEHISGQLKVAPEHIAPEVLEKMGKPNREVYDRFVKKYYEINKKLGKKQFLVPYLMSSHPGSTLKSAVKLAEYLRDIGHMPEQVQDFYPTPGTLSTTMFYTGLDPRTMEKVYVPKSYKEKQLQRVLLQYRKKENYHLVKEALEKAGRKDLIGFGKECLIKPEKKDLVKNKVQQQKGKQRKPVEKRKKR